MLRITWGMAVLGSLAPFAGLGLGHPIIGSAMGLIALGTLALFTKYNRLHAMQGISLVFIICIALGACTTVYSAYKKPAADNLAFARKAAVNAHGRVITIIGANESTQGMFTLAAGRTLPVIARAGDLNKSGLYVWEDKNERILGTLQVMGNVEILMESTVGNRELFMASIITKERQFAEGHAHDADG